MNVFTVDVSKAGRRSNVLILSKVIQSDSEQSDVWRHYSGLYPEFVVNVKAIVPEVVEIKEETTRNVQTKWGWVDLVGEEKVLAKEYLSAKKGFEEVRKTLSDTIVSRLRQHPYLTGISVQSGDLNVAGDAGRANLGTVDLRLSF